LQPAVIAATYDRIGLSIAAYEASIEVSPFNSRFDDYWRACLAAGNDGRDCGLAEGAEGRARPRNILTEQEFDGLIEFGEYCSDCHNSTSTGPGGRPPLFTDFGFDNIGVPRNPDNPFYKMDRVYLDDGQPDQPGRRELGRLRPGRLPAQPVPAWAPLAAAHDGKFRTPTVRNVDKRPARASRRPTCTTGCSRA
jgi:cytochrome c peroxidase